jgi:hypothetical protein
MGDTATIMVNIFDGTRQPITIGPSVKNILIRVIDGQQNEVSADFHTTANVRFEVPFCDGPGDNYAVIAFAENYLQAGFTPVRVSSGAVQMVDLMLLPKEGTFNFGDASWTTLRQTHPDVLSILSHGAANDQAAQARYEGLMEEKAPSLACLWNLMTAMAGIQLPQGTPVNYLKEIIWQDMPGDELFAPAQDRLYAWADKNLVDQVKTAAQQGEFAPEINPSFFHKGATSSYKQIQFGEANVQLTFHEKNIRAIDGVDCVAVEPDIDYYKDLGAHALLEVLIPRSSTFSGGLQGGTQGFQTLIRHTRL